MTPGELRALADAATPGPWAIESHIDFEWGEASAITGVCGPFHTGEDGTIYPLHPADAAFIAAAREAIPELLDTIQRVQTIVTHARLSGHDGSGTGALATIMRRLTAALTLPSTPLLAPDYPGQCR